MDRSNFESLIPPLDMLRSKGGYPVAVETDEDTCDIPFTGSDVTSALVTLIKTRPDLYIMKVWIIEPEVSQYFPSRIITALNTGSMTTVPVPTIPDSLVVTQN